MTEELEAIRTARAQIIAAEKLLRDVAKRALGHAIDNLFAAYEDITNVAWAAKNGEYNDEGMYPGVTGPVANVEEDPDDPWEAYDFAYGHDASDPRLAELKETLQLLGEDILSDLFASEYLVLATRDGKVEYTQYLGC